MEPKREYKLQEINTELSGRARRALSHSVEHVTSERRDAEMTILISTRSEQNERQNRGECSMLLAFWLEDHSMCSRPPENNCLSEELSSCLKII